ncbi:hypothetical protein ACYOEI_04180 [Singulisphaera rosea]
MLDKKSTEEETTARIMRDTLHDFVGKQLVSTLGMPVDLLRVQVRPVGVDHYRANVFVGKDFNSGRIANSFFLSTDPDGNILSSTPKLVRLY